MPDLAELRRNWEAAKRAWNDSGPLEEVVKAGEDLFFAAADLIDALSEEPAPTPKDDGPTAA